MRVPIKWLREYLRIDLPARELAERMTMAGLKIEAIEHVGADWQDVVVGEIVDLKPHPASRKPLHVARVSLGAREITVVTGAQNVRTGDRIPVVLVGGTLPHGPDGTPMAITAKPMAGITSDGMLASERELGISNEHSGILVLHPEVPVGARLEEVLGDQVLDIETHPNRPDTLSMIGIAREVAAITGQALVPPDRTRLPNTVEWLDEESIPVAIEDADLCYRYSALRIDGVQAGRSPYWLEQRLEAAGMRPISLLVDLSNYVMLEYGQPMHAFAASMLRGGRIVVRRALGGERITTLDGVKRVLSTDDLVIADGERAVAVAGVMGGENSEITADATAIVLESATFNPLSVRRTAQRLGLRTEASSRFEKDLPPEQTVPALERYLQLLAEITGAPLRVAHVSDEWPVPTEPRFVRMPIRDLHRLVGLAISRETAIEHLLSLGIHASPDDDAVVAEIPYWRRADLAISADLVEEVARLVGYEVVLPTLPRRTMPPSAPLPEIAWEETLRERLWSAGVSEVVTNSLTSPERMARLLPERGERATTGEAGWPEIVLDAHEVQRRGAAVSPVVLRNPPTRERTVLRMTLIPSLLEVVARNLKHTDERVAFFEIARTYFHRDGDLPYERRTLGIALSGVRHPVTWQEQSPGPYTFFDIKGMVVSLLDELQVRDWRTVPAQHPALHPGQSARIDIDNRPVAYLGQLHPRVAVAHDIEGWPVQVAEIDLDGLFAVASDERRFRPLPRFPSARRDIAALVPRDVPADEIISMVRQVGGPMLESSAIFDVYSGTPLPEDRKSVAVTMEFRAPEATLTQQEVAEAVGKIVDALGARLGATLRE